MSIVRVNPRSINMMRDVSWNIDNKMSKLSFRLETEVGDLLYSPNNSSDYTEFVCAMIEMVIAYGKPKIDDSFATVMKTAIQAYRNGDIDFDTFTGKESEEDDDEEESEYESYTLDPVTFALEELKQDAKEEKKAFDKIKELNDTEEVDLRIVYFDAEKHDSAKIANILSQKLQITYLQANNLIKSSANIRLCQKDAYDLYVKLRVQGIYVDIKPVVTPIKPIKNKLSKNKYNVPNGSEVLNSIDGII